MDEQVSEWHTLCLNFSKELKKPEPNWLLWTISMCPYRGFMCRQVQIALAEVATNRGKDPSPILRTGPSVLMDQLGHGRHSELAKEYCVQLMIICKAIIG